MNKKAEISIIHDSKQRIFGHYPMGVIEKIESKLNQYNISVIRGRAIEVTDKFVVLSDERQIPYHYIIWATGANAPEICSYLGVELSKNLKFFEFFVLIFCVEKMMRIIFK